MKKILVVGIILLLLGSSIPTMAQPQKNPQPLFHTLYVGGSGPGNYTRIQDAINASVNGDTVFVFDDLSPYQENVRIDKSITVIGENQQTTKIISPTYWDSTVVIHTRTSNVTVSGFSIDGGRDGYIGIAVGNLARDILIKNNTITNECVGINIAGGGTQAKSSHIEVRGNTIKNGLEGIYIYAGDYINIISNSIANFSEYGIYDAGETCFQNNIIALCKVGLFIDFPYASIVINNDFRLNEVNAFFDREALEYHIWFHNYWGRPRIMPKAIFGILELHLSPWGPPIPAVNFDIRPALIPNNRWLGI